MNPLTNQYLAKVSQCCCPQVVRVAKKENAEKVHLGMVRSASLYKRELTISLTMKREIETVSFDDIILYPVGGWDWTNYTTMDKERMRKAIIRLAENPLAFAIAKAEEKEEIEALRRALPEMDQAWKEHKIIVPSVDDEACFLRMTESTSPNNNEKADP